MLFDPNIIVILTFFKKYKTNDPFGIGPYSYCKMIGFAIHQSLIQLLNKNTDELMELYCYSTFVEKYKTKDPFSIGRRRNHQWFHILAKLK